MISDQHYQPCVEIDCSVRGVIIYGGIIMTELNGAGVSAIFHLHRVQHRSMLSTVLISQKPAFVPPSNAQSTGLWWSSIAVEWSSGTMEEFTFDSRDSFGRHCGEKLYTKAQYLSSAQPPSALLY